MLTRNPGARCPAQRREIGPEPPGPEKKQVHKLDNCSFLIWRRNSVEREPLDWYRLSFWDVLGADIVSALIRAMAVLVRVLFHMLQLAV